MAADRKNEPVFVDSVCTAVEFLKMPEGPVFVTTGSKELSAFLELPDWETRVYARVLSMPDVVKTCADMGFYGIHLIAMQGPFSEEMNRALLQQTKAAWLVTKDTGITGGFPEKVRAARSLGVRLVIIRRPEESGLDYESVLQVLEAVLEQKIEDNELKGTKKVGLENKTAEPKVVMSEAESSNRKKHEADDTQVCAQKKRTISCIGIGMGTLDTLTHEAAETIRNADILFGAKRILESVEHMPDL